MTRRRWTRRVLWTLQCLTAAMLAMASWSELGHVPRAALFAGLERLGSSQHNLALAVFGLVCAIGVLDIDTAGITAFVLCIVSASAIVSLGAAGEGLLAPLITFVATVVIGWHRRSELSEFARYLLRGQCERLHILCPEDDVSAARRKPLRDNDALLT